MHSSIPTAEAPETSGIPHAIVLRRMYDRASLPGWARATPAKLDTSIGCQDHTPWSYASAPFVFARFVALTRLARPATERGRKTSLPPRWGIVPISSADLNRHHLDPCALLE